MRSIIMICLSMNLMAMEFDPLMNPPQLFTQTHSEDELVEWYCNSERLAHAERDLEKKINEHHVIPEINHTVIIECPILKCNYVKSNNLEREGYEKSIRLTLDCMRKHITTCHDPSFWDVQQMRPYVKQCINKHYLGIIKKFKLTLVYEFECYCPGCNAIWECPYIKPSQLEELLDIKLEEMCQHFATHETINSQDYDELIRTHFKIVKKYQAQ